MVDQFNPVFKFTLRILVGSFIGSEEFADGYGDTCISLGGRALGNSQAFNINCIDVFDFCVRHEKVVPLADKVIETSLNRHPVFLEWRCGLSEALIG